GWLARLMCVRGWFAMLSHTWLALGPVVPDTETTGLDAVAQALEIGLVNARGVRIFETRLTPTVGIDPAAAAVQLVTEPDRFPVLS
uniref:hypothetical protein n=1 Tax=Salmonella enterica TaxID=28901 RepID=UPI0020C2DC24